MSSVHYTVNPTQANPDVSMSKRRRHLSQHHVLIVIFISETIKSIFIEFTMRIRKEFLLTHNKHKTHCCSIFKPRPPI